MDALKAALAAIGTSSQIHLELSAPECGGADYAYIPLCFVVKATRSIASI